MMLFAKISIILFGIFLIAAGLLMLIDPKKAKSIIRKAGSTNFINYAEITIRMIPATGMILYAEYSKFPEAFRIVGWFMIATSLVLYAIPRKTHHSFSLKCADLLRPIHLRLLSPMAMFFGLILIYSIT